MKNGILMRSLVIALAMAFGTSTVSAQSFFDKVKKAASTVVNATTSTENSAESSDEQQQSEEELKGMVSAATLPLNLDVVKVYAEDDSGNRLKNDDGTDKYSYRLRGDDGKFYDANVAKKYMAASWKAGGMILAKVGGGAVAGAAVNAGVAALLGGDVKKAAITGAATGGAAGLLKVLQDGDIKKIKENRSTLKDLKKKLAEYQKSFTEEGLPRDASVDLTPWEGCEEIAMVDTELMEKLAETAKNAPDVENVDDILAGIDDEA